jgi:formylglycine-generating enzyme required for sulfatase activity
MSRGTALTPLSLAIRINARCDAFERAWKEGSPPQIDKFAAGWRGSERAALLRELLGVDVQYRVASRDEVTLPDYAAGYPEISSEAGVHVPRVLGPYVLLERVGAGGMGTVYRGVHRRMKRDVAVKVLRPGAGDRARLRELFDQEIRAAARLSHPNIVTAYDAGEEGEVPYLVSEFVEGENLATVVRREGPLPVDVAIDYVLQAARGLQYAHEQGVIHRDVKPANLMLDERGMVRVMDVGLARVQGSALGLRQEKRELGMVGTPGYMAPEQAAAPHRVDARADVYGLGCTLYFLVTGRATSLESDAAPSLAGSLARLNPLLGKMLARSPEDRHASMREVIRHVERLRDGRSGGRGRKLMGLISVVVVACLVAAAVWNGVSTSAPVRSAEKRTSDLRPAATHASTGMQFRLIPPGRCWIGSTEAGIERMLAREPHPDMRQRISGEKKRLAVIARPLYVGTTEVTVGQFRGFVEATGYVSEVERERRAGYGLRNGAWVQDSGYCWRNLGQPLTDDHPVCNVTYADAAAFCDWLTLTSGDGSRFRLPTESEWEYACRAGGNEIWPFGNTPSLLEVYAWCRSNAGGVDNLVRAVATRSANAFGLFDMLGNVQELCVEDSLPRDAWTPALVLKGGNIGGGPLHVRPAARNPTRAHAPEGGFRVVMEPGGTGR